MIYIDSTIQRCSDATNECDKCEDQRFMIYADGTQLEHNREPSFAKQSAMLFPILS